MNFTIPKFGVQRVDSPEIRQKILNISYVDWKKLEFSKGTLHYKTPNQISLSPLTAMF